MAGLSNGRGIKGGDSRGGGLRKVGRLARDFMFD